MRTEKKIYVITTSGKNEDDGREWSMISYFKAENAEIAIEAVKEHDRVQLSDEAKHKVDDSFKYEAIERTSSENGMKAHFQRKIDSAVDNALESAEYLLRNMTQLVSRLKFHRDDACYNQFGEIQGAASSVEITIGQLVALQEVAKDLKYRFEI